MRLPDRSTTQFRRQRGVVLFISLIVLVAMTLAGIALVRSVDTTNLIAGNLAFKQGATLAADTGIETARNWLLTQTNTTLWNDSTGNGYYSFTPTTGKGTETPWPQYNWAGASVVLAADAAGNQVSYVIQRLCSQTGDTSPVPPVNNSCINTAGTIGAGVAKGTSKGAGRENISVALQYYYRVTARIIGPRNTVSYVQAIIQI